MRDITLVDGLPTRLLVKFEDADAAQGKNPRPPGRVRLPLEMSQEVGENSSHMVPNVEQTAAVCEFKGTHFWSVSQQKRAGICQSIVAHEVHV